MVFMLPNRYIALKGSVGRQCFYAFTNSLTVVGIELRSSHMMLGATVNLHAVLDSKSLEIST